MLNKTDFCRVRRARITLQCELRMSFYNYDHGVRTPDLDYLARSLRELEYKTINTDGSITMTLSTVTPVGFYDGAPPWLVVELTEVQTGDRSSKAWEELLARSATAIVELLARYTEADDRITTVEYDGDKCFVIMDSTD